MTVPSDRRAFVVLPAYNEELNLVPLLNNLQAVSEELSQRGIRQQYVVVDDGSTDSTAEILNRCGRTFPIRQVTHKVNQGLGNTIRDGLRSAAKAASPTDYIVTMDADNTHPPRYIPAMIDKLDEGYDIVIASRFRRRSRVLGLSAFRRTLSFGARMLFQVAIPIDGVRDYTCGYRAFRASTIQSAFDEYGDEFVEYSGFHAMADILLKLAKLNARCAEIPFELEYNKKGGVSKMAIARTTASTVMLVARRAIGR